MDLEVDFINKEIEKLNKKIEEDTCTPESSMIFLCNSLHTVSYFFTTFSSNSYFLYPGISRFISPKVKYEYYSKFTIFTY